MGLKFQASDLTSDVNPGEVFIKTFTQLEHLQNLFFADRLLQRYNHPNNGELLVTSFTMVTLTLHFWMNQDRFSSPTMRRNFEWIVSTASLTRAQILTSAGVILRRPRSRHLMPGAFVSDFYRLSSAGQQSEPLQHHPAAEYAHKLFQLGAILCTKRNSMLQLQRHYSARARPHTKRHGWAPRAGRSGLGRAGPA